MILYLLFLILVTALGLLVTLAVIDLRVRLLPNVYVFPFAGLGIVFHSLAQFDIIPISDMVLGGALGYGLLWIIRFFANRHYGQDSLGLGDVKLMGAAGLWLGTEGILFALTLGAFAGVAHGIGYALAIALKNKTRPDFHRLMIPAGPGFIVGIIAVAIWLYTPYFTEWLHGFGT
ncbi:MAG: prepilin peptidase [Alphaproteobacteria bacterium]|nr:prepilin peptidase [Alphaproteobacteria bacterium]